VHAGWFSHSFTSVYVIFKPSYRVTLTEKWITLFLSASWNDIVSFGEQVPPFNLPSN